MVQLIVAAALLMSSCKWGEDLSGIVLACPDQRCPSDMQCIDGLCRSEPPDAGAGEPPPWWDDIWPVRRPLTIENGVEAAPGGILIPLMTSLADLGIEPGPNAYEAAGLAFWDGASWQAVLFYPIFHSGGEAIWFPLRDDIPPGGVDNRYWLYSGRTDTSTPTTSSEIWAFFDFFTGPDLDGSAWEGENVTFADGQLVLGAGAQVRSLVTWPPGYSVDFPIDAEGWQPSVWFGFQRTSDLTDDQPMMLWSFRAGQLAPEFEATGIDGSPWVGTGLTAPNLRTEIAIDRSEEEIRFWYDGAIVERHPIGPFDTALQIRFGNAGTGSVSIPSVRVRPSMDPLPEVSLGEAESR